MISEKGNLQENLFGKLILSLFEKGVTGILYLRVGGVLKEIYFNQGKIIWAMSTIEEEKLDQILLEEAKLDRTDMDQLKKEHHFSSTVSFLLEEKGMINKTQLNNAFTKQIKRIITHILTIGDGEYNFVYGLSPKKAIDLELSVPDILRQSIFENQHTDYIWKFFGSPQCEVRKNPVPLETEPPSIPNQEELELMGSLDQWTVISSFVSSHLDMDEEKAIQTLFLLAICNLIERREGEQGEQALSASPPTETSSFGSIPPEDEAFLKSLQSSLDAPKSMQEFPEEENIEVDIGDRPEEINFSQKESAQLERSSPSQDLLRTFPVQIPGSTRAKSPLIKFLIWMFAVIAIGTGAAYLYFSGKFLPQKNQTVEPTTQKQVTPETVQAEPETQPDSTTQAPEQEHQVSTPPEKIETTPQPPTQTQTAEETQTPTADNSDSPMSLFSQGRLTQAGDIWKKEIINGGFRYGVLLELDCAQESVLSAFDQFTDKSGLYILNREKNGRNCFLVIWGRFRTEEDARTRLNQIPQYFWSQSSPPNVIELAPYL